MILKRIKLELPYVGETNCYIVQDEKTKNKCTKAACKIAYKFNCRQLTEEFEEIALEKVYFECGDLVNKFYFDSSLIFNLMQSKAKYAIIGYYKKQKNQNNCVYFDEFENDHIKILADSKYDPQNIFY